MYESHEIETFLWSHWHDSDPREVSHADVVRHVARNCDDNRCRRLSSRGNFL